MNLTAVPMMVQEFRKQPVMRHTKQTNLMEKLQIPAIREQMKAQILTISPLTKEQTLPQRIL